LINSELLTVGRADIQLLTVLRTQANGRPHIEETQAVTRQESYPSTCQDVHVEQSGKLTATKQFLWLESRECLYAGLFALLFYCLMAGNPSMWRYSYMEIFSHIEYCLARQPFYSSPCLKAGVSKNGGR
jgi:hypothetical protein